MNDNWPVGVHNLRWARQRWERLSQALSREGAAQRVLRCVYVAVVQVVMV